MFDPKTGFYVRTDVLDRPGEDPFMRSMPNLIDVGIMGHCQHGKSGLCIKSGVQCYQNGLNIEKQNMGLGDFESIIKMAKGTVQQIALGGRGDPNKHENFEDILKLCRENDIVPNYTTSGFNLTFEEIMITKEYCGAVAVSFYGNSSIDSIWNFLNNGVKTNVHYVLSNNSIQTAINMLEGSVLPKVNAIIFLLHKPIGLGEEDNVLKYNNDLVSKFFEVVDRSKVKVGFDSCSCPGIINFTSNVNLDSIDYCEAGRFSCYIDAEMNMMPCSFGSNDSRYFSNLRNSTIKEVWNSKLFDDFRDHFKKSCPNCKNRKFCGGGCPIVPQITLCNRKEKDNENKDRLCDK